MIATVFPLVLGLRNMSVLRELAKSWNEMLRTLRGAG